MTTNTQRDTDAILQMGKDLEEARELLALADVYAKGFVMVVKFCEPTEDMSPFERGRELMRDFLARTESINPRPTRSMISVDDELPPEGEIVTVYVDRFGYYPNYFSQSSRKDGKWTKEEGTWQRISHWESMPPIPGKPKGETK